MKLIFWLAVLFAIIALSLAAVPMVLGPDDLHDCVKPDDLTKQCHSADAIVVVSGGDTAARTAEAIKLYQDGWAPAIIMSGAAYDKQSQSNADAMVSQALDAGVPEEALIKEEYAINTEQNAGNVAFILAQRKSKRIILVTSAYHQRRTYLEFSKQLGPNVTIVNHPTPYDRNWPSETWWATPLGWWLVISEAVKITYITVVPGR